jgi:alpha-mannosidase
MKTSKMIAKRLGIIYSQAKIGIAHMSKSLLALSLLSVAINVCATDTVQPANPIPANTSPVEEIIVIIKTHFDIGYTHRVKEIVQHYRTGMIDKAMDIMDKSKDLPPEQQFAWTGPGWVMSKVLEDWQGQTPERRKRLDDYVKAGRFQFHALPFTLESDACEPEEMARGFIFSSELCRNYGKPLSLSGKMTDVPSHGGALATVLANSGVKFMHIGCNWPSGYVQTPPLFWWEGPDGSRVLTIYSCCYGTASAFNPWGGPHEPNIGRNLFPAKNWPYKIWPAIVVTPDNSGPPDGNKVKVYFDEIKKTLPGVKIRMGTMDDFVNAILKDKSDIPVVKSEMPDTWIHGVMCDPKGIQTSRAVHPRIASAEVLHTQLGLWGVAQPAIANDVLCAYENILLYGEHTWGVAPAVKQYGEAFQKADSNLIKHLEASGEDKTDYIREADKISTVISETNLKMLAANVKASAGSVIVYNPLPWTRSETVEINGKKRFATNVPPCGYKILSDKSDVSDRSDKSDKTTLENAFFKLTLNPLAGSISSLIDKRTGREWIDSSADHALGQYLNERFTYEQTLLYALKYQMNRWGNKAHPGMHKGGMISEKQIPYRAAVSGKGIVKTDVHSAMIQCPADPTNNMPASLLRIALSPDQPFIELELTIQDKAKDNWPEADWLCLPFKVANPTFRVYRQLGSMNPATDILAGANRDLVSVGHGVTITDADGAGIAVMPLDHPLISLDRPGCWKWSKDADEFIPKKPVVYLNLYNNQWNTNFRYWYPGTWSSRVRLSTFDAKTPADAVIATPAIEARNPLLAICATGTGEKLPSEQSGVSTSRKGVLVTAFGQNPDGDGTLLRVWEQAGISGEITVTLGTTRVSSAFASATPVNLRGEKVGEPLKITDGKLTFNLGKYAPASFILKH